MNRGILAGLAAIAVAGFALGAYVVASPGGEEEVVQQAETPTPTATEAPPIGTPIATVAPIPTVPAGATLWRWVNVTIVIPEGSQIVLDRTFAAEANPPHGGPVLKLFKSNPGMNSGAMIDAESGEILGDDILPEDQAAFQLILESIVVSPLQPKDAPWPYDGELPSESLPICEIGNVAVKATICRARYQGRNGGFSLIVPDPAAGISVYSGIGDPGGDSFVGIQNGRSTAFIELDEATGKSATDVSLVLAEDQEIFSRLLSTLDTCEGAAECSRE